MTEDKYGEYIKKPKGTFKIGDADFIPFKGSKYWQGLAFNIGFVWISNPILIEPKQMKHDFDQFMCFYGGNPKDALDFGAIAELSLGEEGEKHIIDVPSIVYVPKGFVHCPLNFKRVDKPIVFLDISLTAEYTRRFRKGDNWTEPKGLKEG